MVIIVVVIVVVIVDVNIASRFGISGTKHVAWGSGVVVGSFEGVSGGVDVAAGAPVFEAVAGVHVSRHTPEGGQRQTWWKQEGGTERGPGRGWERGLGFGEGL